MSVYIRRRVMVGLGLLVVILVIVLLIVRCTEGKTASVVASTSAGQSAVTGLPVPTSGSSGSAAGSATSTAAVPPTGTPGAKGAPCTAGQIKVEALTDKSVYAANQQPQLQIRLTNSGPNACTMNAGTAKQVFTISSGTETYWTSTDCQSGASDSTILVAAGAVLTSSSSVTWDRTRSSKSTCGGARPQVPAGGASYHLAVSIGGFAAAATKQFILQ